MGAWRRTWRLQAEVALPFEALLAALLLRLASLLSLPPANASQHERRLRALKLCR